MFDGVITTDMVKASQNGPVVNKFVKIVAHVECFGPDGKLKWEDSTVPVVVSEEEAAKHGFTIGGQKSGCD